MRYAYSEDRNLMHRYSNVRKLAGGQFAVVTAAKGSVQANIFT